MNTRVYGPLISLLMLLNGLIALASDTTFALPESVISYNHRYFVSNIGAKLTADKDGDGFIAEVSEDSKVINQRFLPKKGVLHAPKGMAIIRDIIYITDIDRIVGYDLGTRDCVFEMDLSSRVSFLNDLVAVDDAILYASETLGGKVFKIDVSRKQAVPLSGEYPSANGLTYNAKTGNLYLNTMGPSFDGSGAIWVKPVKNEDAFKPLPNSPNGIFDGMAMYDETHLIVSDWVSFSTTKGRILLYDLTNNSTEVLPLALQSPADFYFDSKTQTAFIPQTLSDNIFVLNLKKKNHIQKAKSLIHFGLIKSFVGGLYGGYFSQKEISKYGDFGIFAPEKLDGEGTANEGIFYRTNYSGKTNIAADTAKTSVAFVSFFQEDFSFSLNKSFTKETLQTYINTLLDNENGIFAIRISGSFSFVKTRVFPPAPIPYPPLATLIDKQHFFEYKNIKGTLIGYKIPGYLEGINIAGYHFHFLPEKLIGGGHIIDFTSAEVNLEIDILDKFSVVLPKSRLFSQFDFKQDRINEIKDVETGGRKQ